MPIAIVAGALANKPNSGGEAWVRLSWALGLQRLGLDVYFVEEIAASACVDAAGAAAAFADSANLRHFETVTGEFGLGDKSALLLNGGDEHHGLGPTEVRRLLRDADLLINISGHLGGAMLEGPRVRVYVDLDPGFTQAWHADESLDFTVSGHDRHLTVGLNVGRPGCPIPAGGLRWIPTLPPVLLEEWTPAPAPPGPLTFTTVATWRSSYGGLEIGGRTMGLKHHQFRRFVELPERFGEEATFEIALDIHPADSADFESLRSHGWKIVEPRSIAGSPGAFREYVRASGAEFSVAQGVYVESGSGWFSDRTATYLASGRPAVVQSTGLEGLRAAPGALVPFTDLDAAVAGIEAVVERYNEHAEAARDFAREHLDSDLVLGRVLDLVGEDA
jgi:hypothetical protein